MKNFKTYILVLLVFFIGSCTDAIEITQPGRFSADSAFKTTEDLQLALLGTYNTLGVTPDIVFATTFTDEISIGFDNGGQGLGDGRYGFILNSTSTAPRAMWVGEYATINSANRIIDAAGLITPSADEQADYDNALGQAYAIRAFAHFRLFTYFTTDYTNDSAPCAILMDRVPDLDEELGRNTNGEIIALINSDLSSAESLLAETSDPTFINKDFVTAVRARMEAYRGNYSAAGQHAKTLTDKYPLANRTQYFDIYQDIDNTEIIFKLERSVGDSYDTQATGGGGWAGALWAFVNATLTGSPYFEMGRALFNKLDPADVRYDVMIDPSSVIDPNYDTSPDPRTSDILVIRKYPGSDGQPLMNDLKVFRASEMQLIEAEAAAAAGDFAGAAALLKELRDARFGTSTPLLSLNSDAEAFGAILDERRIELALEGHRWIDLKRLGIRGNREVDRDPIDCAINNACSIASDDHRFTLPIPEVELNANSVIREQQNPGY